MGGIPTVKILTESLETSKLPGQAEIKFKLLVSVCCCWFLFVVVVVVVVVVFVVVVAAAAAVAAVAASAPKWS